MSEIIECYYTYREILKSDLKLVKIKSHKSISKEELIWYVSYGSNLSIDRFRCYLFGGKPDGSSRTYSGSSQRIEPLKSSLFVVNYSLYFAKSSSVWNNGGVCFLADQFEDGESTIGRKYLITKTQFKDVFKQENNIDNDIEIDFESLNKRHELIIDENTWYGKIIHLGNQDEIDIVTFTCSDFFENFNRPDPSYLLTLYKGLLEITEWSNQKIIEYLISKRGVKENYKFDELQLLIENQSL